MSRTSRPCRSELAPGMGKLIPLFWPSEIIAAANTAPRSLPPCGGGLGWGVVVVRGLPTDCDPPPPPPPPRGRGARRDRGDVIDRPHNKLIQCLACKY